MSEEIYEFLMEPLEVPEVETSFRRIKTAQPAPQAVELLQQLRMHEPLSMTRELPVVWHRASDFQVEDPYGNRWLDFTSGIFVANAGHSHPKIRAAINEMVDHELLHHYSYPSEVRLKLVDKLTAISPQHLDTVLLLTTGAETTEAAIKCARIHGQLISPDRVGIVSLELSFHGKTMGAQTASGRLEAKQWIGRLDPNFHSIPVPYAPLCELEHGPNQPCDSECFLHSLEYLFSTGVDSNSIVAFIVEPYQGWSAAMLPTGWIKALRSWADEHGALLIFDEVQAGIGRTGRLFAHEHFGVEADLVCCGKGISSSLPLAAVLGRRALLDNDGSFHSTHGGNPVCCAAALANLEVIEQERLVEAGAEVGKTLERSLILLADRFGEFVGRVEGVGMVWALHLVDPGSGDLDSVLADMVIEEAMRRGLLLVRTGVGTIKIGPPLSTPAQAILEGVEVLEQALDNVLSRRPVVIDG